MKYITLLALTVVGPLAHSAEPPDWYAHIPAEQRAALLATRPAGATLAAIGGNGMLAGRGLALTVYGAPAPVPLFDLTQIGKSNLTIHDHNRARNRVSLILREYRRHDESRRVIRNW